MLILTIVWGVRVMKRGFIWMFSPEASLPFDSKIPYVWNDYCPVSVHAISPSEESSQQDETGRSSFLLPQLDWDTWHHPSAAKHEWRDLKLLCYHTCCTYCCFPRGCHGTWSKCRRPSSHICLKIFIEKCNTVMIFLTMKNKFTFFKSLSDKPYKSPRSKLTYYMTFFYANKQNESWWLDFNRLQVHLVKQLWGSNDID